MNKPVKYVCPKCGGKICRTGQIGTSGKLITRIINIQSKRFTTITCESCRYTEFYNLPLAKIGEVIDLYNG